MRRGSNRKLMGESLSRAGRIANAVINNLPPVHQHSVVCRRRRAVGEPQRPAGPGPGSARVPPRVIMSCAPFLPRLRPVFCAEMAPQRSLLPAAPTEHDGERSDFPSSHPSHRRLWGASPIFPLASSIAHLPSNEA